MSHDKRSIKWLGAPKQRSRSTGLAKQTGKSRTKQKTDVTQVSFSERNTSSHSLATLWVVLYLYEKHSRGRGDSHSGIDKCCRLLLWSHSDCTGPKRTAAHRSTPRPLYRTEKQRGTILNYITLFPSILQKIADISWDLPLHERFLLYIKKTNENLPFLHIVNVNSGIYRWCYVFCCGYFWTRLRCCPLSIYPCTLEPPLADCQDLYSFASPCSRLHWDRFIQWWYYRFSSSNTV